MTQELIANRLLSNKPIQYPGSSLVSGKARTGS